MLKVKLLRPEAKAPEFSTPGAVGMDLYTVEQGIILNHWPTRVRTGIAIAIEPGYGGFIYPRSGLAVKQGVDRMAGVIDPDYRGELIVVLTCINGTFPYLPGERIAQLVIHPVSKPHIVVVEDLDQTARGEGGFGSTGTSSSKPHARLHNATIVNGCLTGNIYGHPRWPDGEFVRTSYIIQKLSENEYETCNTIYTISGDLHHE